MSLLANIFGGTKKESTPPPQTLGTIPGKSAESGFDVLKREPEKPIPNAEPPTDHSRQPGQGPDLGQVRAKKLREAERLAKQRGPSMLLPVGFREAVARNAGIEIVTATEKIKLQDIELRWRRGSELLTRLAEDRNYPGRAARRGLQEALEKDAQDFLAVDAWSRSDIQEDCDVKIKLVKTRLKEIAAEALPIVEASFARLAEAAESLAEEQERLERERFAKWAIPFAPSAVIRALRQFTWQLPESIPSRAVYSLPPSTILPEAFE